MSKLAEDEGSNMGWEPRQIDRRMAGSLAGCGVAGQGGHVGRGVHEDRAARVGGERERGTLEERVFVSVFEPEAVTEDDAAMGRAIGENGDDGHKIGRGRGTVVGPLTISFKIERRVVGQLSE